VQLCIIIIGGGGGVHVGMVLQFTASHPLFLFGQGDLLLGTSRLQA
jgi:hypothetical protein